MTQTLGRPTLHVPERLEPGRDLGLLVGRVGARPRGSRDVALGLEEPHDLVDALLHRPVDRVDAKLGVPRLLVRIVDAGEPGELAGPRARPVPLVVARLAGLGARDAVDLDEVR